MRSKRKTFLTSLSSTLMILLITGNAGSMTIQWDAVDVSDLEGYMIHCGNESGSYSTTYDVGDVEQYDMQDLETGCTYYLAVTA